MIDLLIAGGGPAGLFTALLAHRAGLQTIVIEPRAAPIDKACGEGLMPAGLRCLQAVGLEPEGYDLAGIRYLRDGVSAEARFRSGLGRGVRRTTLHRLLSDAVSDAGVPIRKGSVRGIVQRQGRVEAAGLQARYLVAADGLHSPLRHELGLAAAGRGRRRWGVRRHYEIEPWTSFVEVHWGLDAEAYVTPVAQDRLGVAILSRVQRSFDEHLVEFPALVRRLANSDPVGGDRGAGPLSQRTRSRVAGRVLLVGDAAGYVDALTGEGLALSFASSEALISSVLAEDPDRYEREWRRLSRSHRAITHALLSASGWQPARRLLVPAARRVPGIFGVAVNTLAG